MQRERSMRLIRLSLALVWAACVLGEIWGRLRDKPINLNLDKAKDVRAGHWRCNGAKARALGKTDTPDLIKQFATTADWYRKQGWL